MESKPISLWIISIMNNAKAERITKIYNWLRFAILIAFLALIFAAQTNL